MHGARGRCGSGEAGLGHPALREERSSAIVEKWYGRVMSHRHNPRNPLLLGIVAGAVGTVALNVATYADMAIRGRAGSSMPSAAAGKLAEDLGLSLGEDDEGSHRKTAVGQLLGYVTGLGVGVGYGALARRWDPPVPAAAVGLGLAAMASTDLAYTALGVSDPRTWSAKGWAADVVPHAAYGAAAAAAYKLIAR